MKKIILLLLLSSYYGNTFGQIWTAEANVDKSNLSPWIVDQIDEYEGAYFYGESEAESELTISIAGDLIIAQLENGEWNIENEEVIGWISNYINYTNVKIEGNKFYSDETNGEFVIYLHDNKSIKCLKMNNPPVQMSNDGEFELGPFSNDVLNKRNDGEFFQTKFEIIDYDHLNSLSLGELIIMRNEIYARYGYIFSKNGAMALYFENQEWYNGVYKNIDSFLTAIEKRNLINIQKIEKEKQK
ncbi:YARHG domain-containing protein [Aureibaculum sp. A20]|uniref:YARHG domain-containing protein n=1 Tax=Aureibaculum flavum TaxID=2795986 RepID=A0ABS0WV37_9FLAO|nr:YARHG domain-containing protein [Aureibaculum flavum]MBJ2175839.1 YARHG domain-containing protein [Aureibaculum flavum]